jgi:hypothetical protein
VQYDLEHCGKLQRLFLSYNELTSLNDLKNVHTLYNLQEMSLDNNPICADKYYKRNLIACMAQSALKVLDSKRLSVSGHNLRLYQLICYGYGIEEHVKVLT